LKDYVLEQKKGYLEAIRDKNMKIMCKNTDTSRAMKTQPVPRRISKPTSNQNGWHGPCLQWHGRARLTNNFLLLFLLRKAACF